MRPARSPDPRAGAVPARNFTEDTIMSKKTETPTNRPPGPGEFAAPRRDWLVEGLLRPDRSVVLAGGRAELTMLAIDLAVSLGTGTPFLGYFAAPRRRTALCCYGTNYEDVLDIAEAVAADRGKDFASGAAQVAEQEWAFRTRAERQEVVDQMRAEGVEVVILDTIRCALGTRDGGGSEPRADCLPAVIDAFLDAGVTPVLTNGMQCPVTPRLDALTFLDLRRLVRQWAFFGRDERRGMRGPDAYRLTAGAGSGDGRTWDVRANPGRLRSDDGSLKWKVAVLDGSVPPDESRGMSMVATREDADTIDAESEAEVRANRGLRLKGDKVPRRGA